MKHWRITAALLVVALTAFGCASQPAGHGWVTLLDGPAGLENWNRIGDANWRVESGAIVADKGKGGHLVSKKSYKDFEIYAEFWADHHTNSGIFIRATDPKKVGAVNSYEVNIYDQRPGQEYSTGGIVGFSTVPVPAIHKAGGKWNTMEIYAKGAEVTVKFNGAVTTSMRDSKFASGPFTLQYGNNGDKPGGPIMWRKVMVKAL